METENLEQHAFQAEVARLLHLMVHSVYSEKEVFLRELISNAADACEKLRYEAITQPALAAGDTAFRIRLSADKANRRLIVADNGIGMGHDELIANLGTIARSGTSEFLERVKDSGEAIAQIGQFGVGFYAAFMVADKVDVYSRKAGDDAAWHWSSDGTGTFSISPATAPDGLFGSRGTAVVLHLREGEDEYLEESRLRTIVKTYSDHVGFPIEFADLSAGDGPVPISSATALWALMPSEVSADQYKEFYRHIAHAADEPLRSIHYKAEGRQEYSVLVFIPSAQPYDLFDPARQARLKLYVRRVFISDEAGLLPAYLRFVRGLVDSEDLPLNISREMLQNHPLVAGLRKALTNRVLAELKKMAEKEPDSYEAFWSSFGAVLKEGLYEDPERRETLLELARFRTTKSDGNLRTLANYVDGMAEGQEAIYYVTGATAEAVARSPHLEGYRARGVEVLLLSDPVDEFWVRVTGEFAGKPFRSITQGAGDLDKLGGADSGAKGDAKTAALVALAKQVLEGEAEDVRLSARLVDSPVCLVAGDHALDRRLERILREQQGAHGAASLPVLELNPGHPAITALAERLGASGTAPELENAVRLLFDLARLREGETLGDAAAFSAGLSDLLAYAFRTGSPAD